MSKPDRDWFRRMFDAAGISQNQVAAELAIPRSSMTNLLEGKRALKADEAAALAEILDVPLAEILRRFGIAVADHEHTPQNITHVIDSAGTLTALQNSNAVAPPVLDMPEGAYCVQLRTSYAAQAEVRGVDGWILYTSPFDDAVAKAVGRWVLARNRAGQVGIGALIRAYQPIGHYSISGPVPLAICEIVAVALIHHILP
ncbi:hypothetical protein CEK28_08555 [Xenophilus sp. AP218F]|nr:hypothetical protein CEK28_08555 [Xenophilus sp. AP218F]